MRTYRAPNGNSLHLSQVYRISTICVNLHLSTTPAIVALMVHTLYVNMALRREVHKKLKIRAAQESLTMNELIESLLKK